MPYAPTVNDRSGEILAQHQINAANMLAAAKVSSANTDMQTKQFLGEKIGNVGTALTGVLQKKQEDASKATSIGEALNTMQATLPTYGPEGVALQDIITKRMAGAGNNLDKMSGIYMAFQPAVQNLQSRYNQQANIENYKDLYDYKASLGGPGTNTAPKLDAQYGREFYMGLRNNNRTHEQALQDMRNAGLNWAINDIERPQNQGLFNIPNPAPAPGR